MNARHGLFLLAFTLSMPAVGQETYNIDPTHTYPGFEILHAGYSLQRGSFNKTTGKIVLDRAAKTGSIDVTIDASTVETRNAARDVHMRSERFFNVAQYPTMTFKSTKLKFDGDNLVGADGELTLLGVTKLVTLTVANFKCGQNPFNKTAQMCGAEVTAMIKRSEWGMMTGIPGIADDVRIEIPVEAVRE